MYWMTAVFWDVTPCNLVIVIVFEEHDALIVSVEDWSQQVLCSAGNELPDM
jgi:hypothetical protein